MKVIYEETAGSIDSFQYEELTRALEIHFQITEDELINMQPLTVEAIIRRVVQPVARSIR